MIVRPSQRTTNFDYAIRHVVQAAEALERRGRAVTYLNIGDPQTFGFRPPATLVEIVARQMRDGFTGYTHSAGLPDARAAVADYATALGGTPTTFEDVMMTAGASEAADLLLSALLDSGDEVLTPAPGYPIYPAIINKLGGRTIYYHLDPKDNWQPSLDEIQELITPRTRALVLINPNNPTGAITPDETTRLLLELAAENNLLVISDEVYRELCFEQSPQPASVTGADIDVPIATLESLSKTHCVPGWRVGWMRFSHKQKMRALIDGVMRLAGGRLCSPTPAQYAVRPALESEKTFVKDFTNEMRRRRDFVVRRVAEIEGLSCVAPQSAFYLMAQAHDLNGDTDERFVLDLLEATGILTVHGSGFGADPRHGFFRIVFLADEVLLDEAFAKIENFVTYSREKMLVG